MGAIDAGSNALRVCIARAMSPTEFSVVEAERVPVRLGHRTFTHGEVDARTIEAAVGAFSRFRKLFDQHHVTRYRAVATSALRNAANREELIDRLHRELSLELEVIDGEEETRLGRLAVEHSLRSGPPPELIVDLGGGSLEVTESDGAEWVTSSMKIGTVRLLETFGLSGAISDDEARLIRRYISATLRSNLSGDLRSVQTAVACGGNAEALAALYGQTDRAGVPTLKLSALEEALPGLLEADVGERMAELGVRQDRAEVIAVAGLVFAQLGKELGLKKLIVPGVGIREGILVDLLEQIGAQVGSREPTVLASSRAFAARLGHNTGHGAQVQHLARALFDQLGELHQLPDRCGVVLEVAALLHDIGEVVHRRAHHKHGEYMILNGRIPGLESPEREMVAALVRAHRKSMPDPKKHAVYGALPPERQAEVDALAPLLRVADELDADHRQRIEGLRTSIKNKKVVLHLEQTRTGTALPPSELRKAQAFEDQFGRRLTAEVVEVAPPSRRRPVGRRSE